MLRCFHRTMRSLMYVQLFELSLLFAETLLLLLYPTVLQGRIETPCKDIHS